MNLETFTNICPSLVLCSILHILTVLFGFIIFGGSILNDVLANFDTDPVILAYLIEIYSTSLFESATPFISCLFSRLSSTWVKGNLIGCFWAKSGETHGRKTRENAHFRGAASEVGRWAPTHRANTALLASWTGQHACCYVFGCVGAGV
ncbi:transmembrane protein, putative [Medicago truncatula]|uniref:Transmembrane protein, putative n=1 Tax=Medicago truncatula TaxID=3880 RepID=G7KLE7_MEDTR|nr:transmembrane protein, putative [Medicago truncatula]